ncbi:MAG: sigma-54-dependent Fis family transcriptional regulator [Desulfobacteraceae bacterium]|nr:sigma-54-dependent Fis family transcriptional regulator [Desulfobacteraceae bacterium]
MIKNYDKKKGIKNFEIDFKKLSSDEPENFVKDVISDKPILYIIPQSDIDTIIIWKDFIYNLGTKHPDSAIFVNYNKPEKIPLIEGKYFKFGKIEGSFETFLIRVADKKTKIHKTNAFVLGLNDNFLLEFFKKHESEYTEQLSRKIKDSSATAGRASHSKSRVYRRTEKLKNVLYGNSTQMVRIRDQIIRAGQHTQNVLLLGETGTGKSLAARAIHTNSTTCKDFPFTTFACGSVTGTLFESELFGHVKGAFTGALHDRKGLWREAENGTLFFDEIGDLPLDQQAKILVSLDRKVIRPVGSDKEFNVDARLIFATNRDLDAMVKQGTFRADLYWRIRYITVEMPPLRDQKNSVPYIAQKFWGNICVDPEDVELSKKILDKLQSINWSGNIRSLKAVLMSLYYDDIHKRPKKLNDLLAVLASMRLSSSYIGEFKHEETEIDLHRVECLRHLKKNEEWIRSCQKMFEPFFQNNKKPKTLEKLDTLLLRNRFEQSKTLTNKPYLFFKENSFMVINKLQGKLAYFSELIENKLWTQATKYLDHELKENLDKAQSLLFKSVQALLR